MAVGATRPAHLAARTTGTTPGIRRRPPSCPGTVRRGLQAGHTDWRRPGRDRGSRSDSGLLVRGGTDRHHRAPRGSCPAVPPGADGSRQGRLSTSRTGSQRTRPLDAPSATTALCVGAVRPDWPWEDRGLRHWHPAPGCQRRRLLARGGCLRVRRPMPRPRQGSRPPTASPAPNSGPPTGVNRPDSSPQDRALPIITLWLSIRRPQRPTSGFRHALSMR